MEKLVDIFNHYNLHEPSVFKKISEYNSVLLNEGKTIFETLKLSISAIKNIQIDDDMELLDCIYHFFFLKFKSIYKINSNDITTKLPLALREGWRERFNERIQFINMHNMSYIDIEKYLLKKYNIECNVDKYKDKVNCFYDCILVIKSQNKKGRPRLPSYLKDQKDKERKEKMRDKMREKYNTINNLNSYLLTVEEFDKISEKIQDENILKKLKHFTV